MNPDLVVEFLKLNQGVSRELRLSEGKEYGNRVNACGFYRDGKIVVFENRCTKPGTGYSWPGHISDRTIKGVLAHELGHHVHESSPQKNWISRNFPISGGRITGYEPNVFESFAETFRLFLLNPTLLEEGRPIRHQFMTDLFLKSPEIRTWDVVLEGIPDRMISRIPKWINAKR